LNHDFTLSPILSQIAAALPVHVDIYLVGGAVRDALLGRESHDLDFSLAGDTLKIARLLANELGGAYFTLDQERQYGRIVLDVAGQVSGTRRIKLDFTTFQGGTLENDLHSRDFTLNAMALDVRQPHKLIDPLGGAGDLVAKRLRVCSKNSLLNDPVRILRAVRQALDFNLKILPETTRLMREAASELEKISPERLRDELFRLLDGHHPNIGIEILDRVGALEWVLPEIVLLKGVEQSSPHIFDVWRHTLDVVNQLDILLNTLAINYDPQVSSNLMIGLVSLRLGRYRQNLAEHLHHSLNPERSLRALISLAGLYHDSGKPSSRKADDQGRFRFFEHDQLSEVMVSKRTQALHLSNLEIERCSTIVRHHMRPMLLSQLDEMPTRRAVYRFFRDTGPAGVDICLLSLADMLATYGPTLKQEAWAHQLDVVRFLLEAWWEHPHEYIAPTSLLNGRDLMNELHLQPGPQVGQLLEAIREAQAIGQVNTRTEALVFVHKFMENLK
jgi:poly(A) polymerase